MGVEILVLSRNKRLFNQVRNFICGRKQTAFACEFINDLPFGRINPTDRGWFILRQRLMAGQIAPIDPENRTQGQSRSNRAQGQHRKDRAEK